MLYFHPTLSLKHGKHRQKRKLEIGLSERLRPIFGTKSQILEIRSCERALTSVFDILLVTYVDSAAASGIKHS